MRFCMYIVPMQCGDATTLNVNPISLYTGLSSRANY